MRRTRVLSIAAGLGVAATMIVVAPSAFAQAEVVVADDFEDGSTQGWFGRGSAEVEVSSEQAHDGGASLLVTGRDATWQGPGKSMLGVLEAGATYEIEAYVRLVSGEDPVTLSVQRRPVGGSDAFDTVAWEVPATADDWVRLAGTYTFDTEDNEQLELYLESPNETLAYYVDDVTVTMTAPPPGGGSGDALIETGFEDGDTGAFGPRGEDEQVAATEADAHSGDWSLLTSGRTEAWNGPAVDVTNLLEDGQTYDFSLWLKLAPDQDPADLRFSIQRDADGESTFETIVPNTEVTADEWVNLSGSYTFTGEVESASVYVESGSALVDFYLDDFSMAVRTPPEIEDIPPLRDVLADDFGRVGVAIDPRETAGAQAELLTRHFNAFTAENDMKWETIEPTEGEFDFTAADQLVEFADQHDLDMYGHTLVWHSQTPDWVFQDADGEPLTDSPDDQQLLLDRMRSHINAIAERYGDRLWAWDVVNEAIDDSQDDGLRRSRWYEILGPEYLNYAFQYAREAFGPDVKLFLNDYNTEFPAKRDAMYDVVTRLQADGVPIDGVGHQLHLSLTRPVSWVDDTLTTFSDLGLIQAVTELDVSISTSTQESLPETPPERLVQQGYYYRDLFEVLRGHADQLESVTVWGLYDARSWLRTWPIDRPHEAPLLFDDDLQAKPAYWGIVEPADLPHLPRTRDVRAGTPTVDGERDLVWQLLPGTVLQAAAEEGEPGTGFQVRWDADNLYALVEVADPAVDPDDRVELYVDDDNAKAGDYQADDAHYVVNRDGTTEGDATAAVAETDNGYLVEVALPFATAGELDRRVGFDVRITDGGTGEQVSWSDQNHTQDTDTSRWGTVTLIGQVEHVDIPRANGSPQVDGAVDAVWENAPAVTTDVLVEGDGDGAKGDFRLLWDAQRLYVLAEVTDPQLDEENSNAWEQDSIEIFVDPGNTKSGAFKPADGQYRISFTNHQSVSGDLDVIGDNLTSAAEVTDDGYRIEASIGLGDMTPAEGAFVGLEFQVNDATDGARTAVHTWHDPTGLSYQDTSRWGVGRLVGLACGETVSGWQLGGLTVDQGVTCVEDAVVLGEVRVAPGASLIATGSALLGPVTATDAATVELTGNDIFGRVRVEGTGDQLVISDNEVLGAITLTDNQTGGPAVVSGNLILGLLSCSGNEPPPTDDGSSNTVLGFARGQCREL